jgi:hypothetical protein
LELHELSLNHALNGLDARERNMLKTFLQVELNEFFMDKIDNSNIFEGVEDLKKSQFIGNFFMWIKNQFSKDSEVIKPSIKKSNHTRLAKNINETKKQLDVMPTSQVQNSTKNV